MVFAIPLADDHPDNALKDRYLSRNEPGTLLCDFITGIEISLNLHATKSLRCNRIELKNHELISSMFEC